MAISPPIEPFHDGLDIPSPELYSMQLDEPHIPSPPPDVGIYDSHYAQDYIRFYSLLLSDLLV
ncbi:hypothetical protein VKT23_009961 [Stygiomarasmius scandens]|uniref:Uncharacterized protein n=1 Tax=Marasmiellus scandens TaxID=2682957 RepID=A0ABR1JGR3_9AGAR